MERAGSQVTIVAFSIMVGVALKAAERWPNRDRRRAINSFLRPLDTETIIASVKKTNRLGPSRKAGYLLALALKSLMQ